MIAKKLFIVQEERLKEITSILSQKLNPLRTTHLPLVSLESVCTIRT
jgi:hypothetical protein